MRVYVKGAPESVVNKCKFTIGIDSRKVALDDEELGHILKDVIYQEFTTKGLRTIAFAYRDLSTDEFNNLKQECNDFQGLQDREVLEESLTFVGVFAL